MNLLPAPEIASVMAPLRALSLTRLLSRSPMSSPTRLLTRPPIRLLIRPLTRPLTLPLFRLLMLTLTLSALSACIVVPQSRDVYDPDCKTTTRQVTLETAYIGGFHRCAGDGCVAMLAAAGFVTAASVVVSGSIAVVGNAVYWFERQGRCARPRDPATAAPSSAASTPQ